MAVTAGMRALNVMYGAFAFVQVVFSFLCAALTGYLTWLLWGVSDGANVGSLVYGGFTLGLFAWPFVFLYGYDRWQTRNGLSDVSGPGEPAPLAQAQVSPPDARPRTATLNVVYGTLAWTLVLVGLTAAGISGFYAVRTAVDGIYFATLLLVIIVALCLVTPFLVLYAYDQWQARNGLTEPQEQP